MGNAGRLSASMICSGWDPYKGYQIYSVNQTGFKKEEECALALEVCSSWDTKVPTTGLTSPWKRPRHLSRPQSHLLATVMVLLVVSSVWSASQKLELSASSSPTTTSLSNERCDDMKCCIATATHKYLQ